MAFTGVGDYQMAVPAEAIIEGDRIWVDGVMEVQILSAHRSGNLIRLSWSGGHLYLDKSDTVIVEVLS
jgi:hypothetical protein